MLHCVHEQYIQMLCYVAYDNVVTLFNSVIRTFHEVTRVKMANISDEMIEAYVSTGEPLYVS